MSTPSLPLPDSRPAPVRKGDLLGKYELIRRIATGGMAEIFLARVTGIKGFEKLVVLKRILPHLSGDGEFIRMFLEEARLVATLNHSNVAQVHDIGRIDDTFFFAMEYVHGVDLRQLRDAANESGRRIPLEHAIAIILGTAAGLHYAHEKKGANDAPLGIVHRDISPSNVLVGFDGCIKLVDFGIAKVSHQRGETKAGTLKGKVSYMSPEQCQAEPLDRRSDIFALGILLYELTTGTLLFDAASELAIMRQIVDKDVPPPSSRLPGYPPELEKIVLTALRRDRTERYATARELQLALESFAFGQRLPVSAVSLTHYLEELFGADLDAWRAAQRAGLSLVDYVTSTLRVDGETASVNVLGSDPTIRSLSQEHDEPRRLGPMSKRAAGIAAIVLVLGAGIYLGTRVHAPSSRAAQTPEQSTNLATASPSKEVEPTTTAPTPRLAPPSALPRELSTPSDVVYIRLVGKPRGARAWLDRKPLKRDYFSMKRSRTTHQLVVSLEGYQKKRIALVPQQDLQIPIVLERTTAQAPSEPPVAKPKSGNPLFVGPGEF